MREDSTENLPLAQKQVSALLQNLPRVESTGDFEARVRSRIANAKAAPRRRWLVPTVAFASLLALLTVGIAFWPPAISGDLAATQPPTEVVESIPKSPFVETVSSSNRPVTSVAAASPTPVIDTVDRNERSLARANGRDRRGSPPSTPGAEGGSLDRGVTPAATINANIGSSALVQLKDYFPMIGVNASFENDAWVVRKVTPDSVADRVGVIEGDIVDSIGSVRLAEKTTLSSSELEPKITVRRGNDLKTLDRSKP